MSLEELEDELYRLKPGQRTSPSRAQKPAADEAAQRDLVFEASAPATWGDELETAGRAGPTVPARTRRWVPFAAAGVILCLALLGGIGLFLSRLGQNGQSVDLVLTYPREVRRGVPFELAVNVDNQTEGILQGATMTVNLPSGIISFNGGGAATNFVSDAIGDIGGGSFARRAFKLVAVGEPRSVQKVGLTLTYAAGRSSQFDVGKTAEVTVGEPAIKLDVTKPTHVLSGSSFDLDVRYENDSDFDFPDVVLEAKYPSSFKFISSSLVPDSLNSYWRLGELKAGSRGDLQIKGSIEGYDRSRFTIPLTVSVNFLGETYPLVEQVLAIAIAPSPVNLQVVVNRKLDYVARIGDRLTYTIQYQNNSGIALADVVLAASLSGELFDIPSLRPYTGAQIDSVTNTITWNASQVPEFRLLAAGATGSVDFDIGLLPTYPIKRLSDKNFMLHVKAHLDSPSVPYYLAAPKTAADASLDTKVSGMVALDAQAFYRDAAAAMVNRGTVPPQVNKQTEYTVHWVITNYATDLKQVIVRSRLEPGVAWTGIVKSNVPSVPLYNERTQEITWTIDKVIATKGVVGAPVEAVFQVRATPNVTQVGQVMPLVSETTLMATDDFTGLSLEARDGGLSTDIPDDKTVGQGSGVVQL